jgi:hypothetical protein
MIIVSQEKNRIINSDNILQIYITIDEDDKGCYIQYEDCNNSYEGLGKYNTEERAKEVLQEITTRHGNWENMKMGQPSGICLPVYEMPED